MTKWDKRFMGLVYEFSTYSKDPSTKVGAIIAKDKVLVSGGFNGFPKEEPDDERLHYKETKYDLVNHAEFNAINNTFDDMINATIYVTHHPCKNCMEEIASNGISRIVVGEQMPDNWNDSLL